MVAILGLLTAMFNSMTRVLLVSRSHRQSKEMLMQMQFYHDLLGARLLKRKTAEVLELTNLSRIVSMPCREETIRGFAAVDLLVIDEAARVPDDIYRAVRPMLAVSKGRLICLSTPYGRRGFFWDAWARGGADWQRIEIPAVKVPRITPEHLAEERRALGDSFYRQEYECSFESVEGLVYPDFSRCVVRELPLDFRFLIDDFRLQTARGRQELAAKPELVATIENQKSKIENATKVGGLDFGFRNPFAALWGFVDRDDVLWIVGEHYDRQKPLSHNAQYLPKNVTWYADPSGATEIAELRYADFVVRRGDNSVRSGIAAVTARLQSGKLRVLQGACPNLLAEAGLYRWSGQGEAGASAEAPLAEHDHALSALRYLISKLDARKMARVA